MYKTNLLFIKYKTLIFGYKIHTYKFEQYGYLDRYIIE